MKCPLCYSSQTDLFFSKKKTQKDYWDCQSCRLIFMDQNKILSHEKELEHYQTHNNDIHDVRYQNFVSDITSYIKKNCSTKDLGLDYGAGPGPVITHVLAQEGFHVEIYDPYFAPNSQALEKKYDFIVSCEVIEHFSRPRKEFTKLADLLQTDGTLILKTHIYNDDIHFPSWYYHADPTHICFYRSETLTWIAQKFLFPDVKILSERLCVLKKVLVKS